MRTIYEERLLEHVIWHCQITYGLDTIKEAVITARRNGFLDWRNEITSMGQHVAEMMLQDFDGYQALFEIEVKKKPSLWINKTRISSNSRITSQRIFNLDRISEIPVLRHVLTTS